MVVVKTPKEFFIRNNEELRTFAIYKTGILDKDVINDMLQSFYVKLIETKALDTFDPTKSKKSTVKNLFEAYILNLFCWQLSYLKKKNYRVKFNAYSRFHNPMESSDKESDDIYDYVGYDQARMKIDPTYDAAIVNDEKERYLEWYVYRFKEYIRNTEPQEEADRLITLLENRYDGCNSRDVAIMLGISDNMAKVHKKKLYKKYKIWLKRQIEI